MRCAPQLLVFVLTCAAACSSDSGSAPVDAGNGLPDIQLSDTGSPDTADSEDAGPALDTSTGDSPEVGASDTQTGDTGAMTDASPDTSVAPCGGCSGLQPYCLVEGGVELGCVECLDDEHCLGDQTCGTQHQCNDPPPPPPSNKDVEWVCQAGECWGKDGRCLPDEVPCKDGAECVTMATIFGESPLPDDEDPGGWCACPDGQCDEGQVCGGGPLALLVSLIDGSKTVPNTCSKPK